MDELFYVIYMGIITYFIKLIPEPIWQRIVKQKGIIRIALIFLFHLFVFALVFGVVYLICILLRRIL